MDLRTGMVVDRYIIEGLLGKGGMAYVYRVRHRQLSSLHALKVLNLRRADIRERLVQEGRIQSTLNHPNVVTVTDLVDISGAPGLIMEYVQGPTLHELLGRGRLSLGQVDGLARGILKGVAAAHAHSLVHRDLKPANILLANVGGELVPKVADFGLAKALAEDDALEHPTRSGAILGTPAYMAPEQIHGARHVDARSDVFSLGTLLYELVTGRRPFSNADPLALLQQISDGRYQAVAELRPETPARMITAIERALRSEEA